MFEWIETHKSDDKLKYDKNIFGLDLDPMTLKLKLDLDIVKVYPYTKNEVPGFSLSKVIAWTHRHRHADR